MKPRDPRRWLDQSGPETEMERTLLDVGREMDPPPDAKDAIWGALIGVGGIAAGAGAASAATSSAGGAAGGAGAAGSAAGAGGAGSAAGVGAAGAAAGGAVAGGALGGAATTGVATFGAGALIKVTTAIGVLGITAAIASGPKAPPVSPQHQDDVSIASAAIAAPPPPRHVEFAPQPSFRAHARDPEPVPELLALPPTTTTAHASPSLSSLLHAPPSPEKRATSVLDPVTRSNDIPLPPSVSTLPDEARVASPLATNTGPSAADSNASSALPQAPPPVAPPAAPAGDSVDGPDQLADEAALVSAARRDLRQGNARSARIRLERGESMFAGGTLEEERKVLYVEALAKTGNLPRAKLEAANFLRAHPASPHAARLRALVGQVERR